MSSAVPPSHDDRHMRLIKKDRSKVGFTLVELLVVIAIMGILGGLVVGLAAAASKKRVITRAKADLARIQTAIADYESTYDQPPPGNPNSVIMSSLYYELTGVQYDPAATNYTTLDTMNTLTPTETATMFGVGGMLNSENPEGFLRIRPKQWAEITQSGVTSRILIAEGEGPPADMLTGTVDGAERQVNPWRYSEISPTYNRATYDLWVEVVVGQVKDEGSPVNNPTFSDQVEIISNW